MYRSRIQVVRLRVVGSSMPLLKSVRASFLGGVGRGLGEFSGTGSRVTGGLNSFALFALQGLPSPPQRLRRSPSFFKVPKYIYDTVSSKPRSNCERLFESFRVRLGAL